jgi:hypothetical protein
LHQGHEHLEAVIHAQPFSGERFALGKGSNDTPKSRHGRENAATLVSVKARCALSSRKSPSPGAAPMPLMLTDAELAMLDALAAPIDANRRPEFLGAVTTKLEAAGPAAIGPGALHRTARTHGVA